MTRAKKQTRLERDKKPTTVLITPRDLDVMILLGLCGYLSLPQIARDLFPSLDRARYRLRQLFNAKYVQYHLVCSTRPNCISLAKKGKELVCSLYPDLRSRLKTAQAINLSSLEHHLLLCDGRLFAAAWAERQKWRLRSSQQACPPKDRIVNLAAYRLRPDAIAQLEEDGQVRVVAVEADTGTESLEVLQSKLERYQLVMADHQVQALWVLNGAGQQRHQGLERLAQEAGMDQRCMVLPRPLLTQRPMSSLPGRAALGP